MLLSIAVYNYDEKMSHLLHTELSRSESEGEEEDEVLFAYYPRLSSITFTAKRF